MIARTAGEGINYGYLKTVCQLNRFADSFVMLSGNSLLRVQWIGVAAKCADHEAT
ncbi:hypothetical protein D3C77_776330 [compost metagenome]